MQKLRKQIKKRIGADTTDKLYDFVGSNPVAGFFIGLIFGRNLNALAKIYRTDKFMSGEHFYTPHYQTHLKRLKYNRINLLEIGVGGYERPDKGGASLRMWKRYFPFGKIYSIDIHDKSALEERRIKIFRGSQADTEFLEKVISSIKGSIDIIIDDGSHVNAHVLASFQYLFPKLKDGGIYIIEDTQTSYWEEYGGDSNNLNNPVTMMSFFKKIPDKLNYTEYRISGYEPDYYDKNISSVHFYHNLIFIYKKGISD